MNIEEYADVLNLELEIRRYPNQNGRYTAKFAKCETKDSPTDGILCGSYGNGRSPSDAINDYLNKIRGKLLVVDAMSAERRSYVVPKELSAI